MLADMAYRGLIRSGEHDGDRRYGKLPFVVGIYEGQVNRLTPQLARDLQEYFDGPLGSVIRPDRTPQLRTVPVNQRISVDREVAQYDDIRAWVRATEGPFGVMNCICRQAKDLAGEPCRQTSVRHNCLTMGSAATVMHEHGHAQLVTRERMLELLDEADREGLVLQPQNTRNPLFVCCCCGCCCVSLRAGKKLAHPVEFFSANYRAEVDADRCDACGACLERCQMEALSMDGTSAQVDVTRCIGCGLCVSSCPTEAMQLAAKAEPVLAPRSTEALYAKIYRERYGTAAFAKTAVKLLAQRLIE
jgi:ferredoxin